MIRNSICILIICKAVVYGQVNPGPRITALGGTGVALQDIWSLQSNQAGLAGLTKPSAAIGYKSEFFLPDLSTQSALIAIPFKRNAFGLSFQNYGFSVYGEIRAGFTYARNFGNMVFAALDFNFHQLKIQKYGSATAYSFEIGLQYQPTDKLLIGGHITNPNLRNYEQVLNLSLPVSIEFGASLRVTGKLLINSGFIKTLDSSADFNTGIEYSMLKQVDLRGGLSVNPFRQYAGFGFKFHSFHMDAALSAHPVLGYSPQVAIDYEF
jgi:hypothetical protein